MKRIVKPLVNDQDCKGSEEGKYPMKILLMRKNVFWIVFGLLVGCTLTSVGIARAQDTKNSDWTPARQEIHENILLSASNYVAYVDPTEPLSASPKGYEPFYLTHYGRHGSRWLIGEWEYTDAMKVLAKAHRNGKLTERGELLRRQLDEFYQTTIDRRGDLTTVGERQHHRIGRRLTEHFPEIFGAKNAQVDARSTVVVRCILSMVAECEELCAFNPQLRIHNDVSQAFQYYLNREPWDKALREANRDKRKKVTFDYNKAYTHPERFCSQLFTDESYVRDSVNASQLMRRVFDICSNMQSHDTDINLYDLFTEEECYDLWRIKNIDWYLDYSSGISPNSQNNLLQNFIATADTIVGQSDFHGATLRFGHEVCVMPLAALMGLGSCYPEIPFSQLDRLDAVWANFRIFPMGSNIQLVFYRPKKGRDGDILVKALLNEREQTFPLKSVQPYYYRWTDVRAYFQKRISQYNP